MLERAVEAMVSQTTVVFRDDSWRTWSMQLNLAKDDAAKGDDDDADPPKETKKDKDPKQAKKASKKDTPPKKKLFGFYR